MKKSIFAVTALVLASLSTAAFADGGGASAGANAGASAAAIVNTENEGSFGTSTPGGANPCAVGGGIGVPGVGGIAMTVNGKSCVISKEADDIMEHCAHGVTLGCRHLAQNNARIRDTLEDAGVIRSEAPNAMRATAPAKPAVNVDAPPAATPVRFTLDGTRYVIEDARTIARYHGCEAIAIEGRERPIIKAGCNS